MYNNILRYKNRTAVNEQLTSEAVARIICIGLINLEAILRWAQGCRDFFVQPTRIERMVKHGKS